MREYLNNPKIVIPLTLVALIWGGFSYGFFDFLASKLPKKTDVVSSSLEPFLPPKESNNRSVQTMRLLMGDNWLTSNWIRESMIKNEPFVADYNFNKETIPEMTKVEELEAEVVVDQETFEAAIAANLGLDRDGFFAVFNNVLNLPVRKRVGDEIYLEDGRIVYIPTFGIADSPRTSEEQKAKVEAVLSEMRLKGVSTEDPGTDGNGSRSTENSALIEIAGRTKEFYRQGDLVFRNPSLGLDEIHRGEDYQWVILVDAAKNRYELRTAVEESENGSSPSVQSQ